MIEIMTQHLRPKTAQKFLDDFAAISRLLTRGLITPEVAKQAREVVAAEVEDILYIQRNVLKEAI